MAGRRTEIEWWRGREGGRTEKGGHENIERMVEMVGGGSENRERDRWREKKGEKK